jgi:hypothetical protein
MFKDLNCQRAERKTKSMMLENYLVHKASELLPQIRAYSAPWLGSVRDKFSSEGSSSKTPNTPNAVGVITEVVPRGSGPTQLRVGSSIGSTRWTASFLSSSAIYTYKAAKEKVNLTFNQIHPSTAIQVNGRG